MNYYRRFPGDYLAHTARLNLLQHGAYTLLLDHLYATEERIPTEDDAMRICRASTSEERSAVTEILQNFFKKTSSGFTNKRYEKEIKKRNDWCKWQKNHRHTKPDKSLTVRPMSSRSPSPLPLPIKEEPKSICAAPQFDSFWAAYPRKLGKQEARKSWDRKFCEGHLGEILLSLSAWQAHVWTDPQFVPYPATWLNQDRHKEIPERSEVESGTRQTVGTGRSDSAAEGTTRAEKRVIEADRQAERIFGRPSGLVERLRPDLSRRPDRALGDGVPRDTGPAKARDFAPSLLNRVS